MNKKEPTVKGLYKLKKCDLERCAQVAAKAFIDDESSKFLLSSKLTEKTLYEFYLVLYRSLYKKMYIFAESENINGFIIFAPLKNSEISLLDFIKAGGLPVIFSLGIDFVKRSKEYEENCVKIRKQFTDSNDWYIFQFGVNPDKQGTGLGSKVIKPVLNWFEEEDITCYLETQKDLNVEIYKHFDFDLKSTDTMPNKQIKQFAMLHEKKREKAYHIIHSKYFHS